MVCRLCLNVPDVSVEIFSEEKIQKIITQFLQVEVTPEDPVSRVICALCWQQLEDFEKFYHKVDEAQKSLSTVCKEFKEETCQNADEKHNDDVAYLNLLKVEVDITSKSDDENTATSDTFHCLDEKVVKVELLNDETADATTVSVPEHVESVCTVRATRGSVLKRQSLIDKSDAIVQEIKPDKKRSQSKNVSTDEGSSDSDDEDYSDGKDDESYSATGAKRKRGRPKKGEEKPKVKKVRSEKTEQIWKTAKEFDEIIKKNMTLTCSICLDFLDDFNDLKRHFRSMHNRRGFAVCCNKRLYKRPLLVDHINSHINPDYFKCSHCGKVMADRFCLRNHILLMHQHEDDKIFQCSYCPKKYARQNLLDHHQVKHTPKEQCAFVCEKCEKRFPTTTTLKEHLNQQHSTRYDKMCDICAKLVRGKAAFERHMEEHKGIVQPQVQCETCGAWLKDKNSLRKHMYKHDGKTYSCNVCGKSAPSKSALESHQRYVHQAVRKFHCTFCEKSFKKACDLKEHLTTHTGEVLYTCPHCPTTFNSKANMHAHRKKKHRAEWEANRRGNNAQAAPTETAPVLS